MLLVTGVTEGGSFSQLVSDEHQARLLMSRFDSVSRKTITWTVNETKQTEVRLAVEHQPQEAS